MKLTIVNGPNLNLLGIREPEKYGNVSFEDYLSKLCKRFAEHEISYFQSNEEGKIIDHLHKVGFNAEGILINAGAYTHTSIAIRDAIAAITVPVVEIHISNVYAREDFRAHSLLAPVCHGVIVGFGLYSYDLGIYSLLPH